MLWWLHRHFPHPEHSFPSLTGPLVRPQSQHHLPVNRTIAASPRAQDLRWDPPVIIAELPGRVFFGAVAGLPRKGVIARAKWGEQTLYLIDRENST